MWDVVSFRPGASPLRALAAVFGTVPENAGRPRSTHISRTKPSPIARATQANSPASSTTAWMRRRLFVYVDQWENLYAMAPAAEDADQRQQHSDDVERFIALLVVVASGPNSRATVVLTVRADFVHQTHPAEHAAAAAAGEHTFRWGLATCGARSRRLPRKWGFRLREGWVRVGRACDSPRVKKHLCNQELRTRPFVDCTPI
jgi:hypothetical protein